MSQEVLIQRSQQVKFDLGLTPGRRRLGEKLREEKLREEKEREGTVDCLGVELSSYRKIKSIYPHKTNVFRGILESACQAL